MKFPSMPLACLLLLAHGAGAAGEPSACGWRSVGTAGTNDGTVSATAIYEENGQRTLFAVGGFSEAWGVAAGGIARWDGVSWASGGDAVIRDIRDAIAWNDSLVVAGGFRWIDSTSVNRIARWDGQAWTAFGDGFDAQVNALAVFDDGSGPTLYAAGAFRNSGDQEIRNIASWNGNQWEPVGGGTDFAINTLGVFDLGDGPALYAGGRFTQAGGQPARSIAKWDGQAWQALGEGRNGWIISMEVFDDGNGPALYTGGSARVNGEPSNPFSKWDGSEWSEVTVLDFAAPTHTLYPILALRTFDDGSGPALYIGGQYFQVNNQVTNALIRWDGQNWESLANGVTGPDQSRSVNTLRVHDLGDGDALYVGGKFLRAGGRLAQGLASWENWSVVCPADQNGDCRLDFFDIYSFTLAYVAGDGSGDFNQDGQADFFDFAAFLDAYSAGCR